MPNKIFIVTGAIQSGKTTSLSKWLQTSKNIFGILTPTIHKKRCFMDVYTKEIFAMEAAALATEDYLPIGKFVFSKNGFNKAIQIINAAICKTQAYILIDEIGPLELQGLGFASILKKALATKNITLILVVRDKLILEVINNFAIDTQKVTYLNNQSNFNIAIT